MKKFGFLFCLYVLAAFLAGCAVKSDLDHPGKGTFPRNYPVD
jgi:hypothetical protein